MWLRFPSLSMGLLMGAAMRRPFTHKRIGGDCLAIFIVDELGEIYRALSLSQQWLAVCVCVW